ncbi:MAG TPA: diaminopimelate decarboxylase [Candidatus Eremiobacteraceae bacterium]|nr:diaminopimelate decarboxylase [Candidatus Eremiobacteraceae bacterium]
MSIPSGASAHNAERTVDVALGGCDPFALTREFGTPLLVIDEAALRAQMERFRLAFSGSSRAGRANPIAVDVTYAAKALMLKAIVRIAHEEGLAIDVCSAGELHTALRAGVPAQRCLMHGCFKTPEEIELAVASGVGYVVVDHVAEIDALDAAGRARGVRQRVLVRVNPEIATDTHEHVQTSGPDSKFGFAIADGQARLAIERVCAAHGLELAGIHCHIGSRIYDLSKYDEEIAALAAFVRSLQGSSGPEFAVIDVGGGIGISERGEGAPTAAQWADAIFEAVERHFIGAGLECAQLLVEPGRALVASAGTTLYTIGVRKTLPDGSRAVIVDGGLSDNPRPALYDARYDVTLLHAPRRRPASARYAGSASHPEVYTVFGRHCETDRLFPDVPLPDPRPGDLLAVHNSGAYTYSMASNYNRFPKPAVVLARAGQAKLIAKRESLDHMLELDL